MVLKERQVSVSICIENVHIIKTRFECLQNESVRDSYDVDCIVFKICAVDNSEASILQFSPKFRRNCKISKSINIAKIAIDENL